PRAVSGRPGCDKCKGNRECDWRRKFHTPPHTPASPAANSPCGLCPLLRKSVLAEVDKSDVSKAASWDPARYLSRQWRSHRADRPLGRGVCDYGKYHATLARSSEWKRFHDAQL